MNRYLRNRLTMLRTVVEHFDQHPDLWDTLEPIVPEVATVRATRDALEQGAQNQAAADTTGLTDQKDDARDATVTLLLDLRRKVRPYARTTNDLDLLHALRHPRSTWLRLPHDTFLADARDVLNRVNAVLPDLVPYKVTADDLTAARTALAKVPRLLGTRDNTSVDGTVATKALDAAYTNALPTLANLDDLVPALIDHPTFVAEYAQARQIPGD